MALPTTLATAALAFALLLAPAGRAWYKPPNGRSYYSVGRAAGLLSGSHTSPYARRAQATVHSPALRPSLQKPAVCIRHVAPSLQSCARLPDGGTFQCKADVLLSLRPTDCSKGRTRAGLTRGPAPPPAN
ncbi:neuropeptide B [Echinops telfairi]|uniref:Neuropeptide B n=1 Tax=Echinops telfairi TaxID=9371 RepID=A0ABM0IWE3_ECHTE|nr:neuropeptide B [Echinops telfairi]